jgi:hypothetical protein
MPLKMWLYGLQKLAQYFVAFELYSLLGCPRIPQSFHSDTTNLLLRHFKVALAASVRFFVPVAQYA